MQKNLLKRVIATALVGTFAAGAVFAPGIGAAITTPPAVAQETKAAAPAITTKAPKYVFMFIGDGMSFPQIQITADYLGAMEQKQNDPKGDILKGQKNLPFMNFATVGTLATFDSTSFCPDSASTATSLATGYKTHSGVINMDESKKVAYETIAEKVKKQLDYKVGVVSSVNLNHATPAAYYAHQASRNNYYEIGVEMVNSGFDYFAGGALKKPTGKDQESAYTLAEKAGYKVAKTQAKANEIVKGDKAIIITEEPADGDAMAYELDRNDTEWSLADMVKKGIEVLDNDKGFFMMVEGGKIDWACHANDAGSTIGDTKALSDAVDQAIAFAKKHPQETLILVTADHETGGLTIGYAGTNYDTFLTNLSNQKISYAEYDAQYVGKYIENKTSFADVMTDVQTLFGLATPANAGTAKDSKLVLTEYEVGLLKDAYDRTINKVKTDSKNQRDYILYGTYEPLSVTITHILNNKSGVNFSSYAHTGLPVPIYADGVGASAFDGYYDNTGVYDKLAALLNVK